MIGLLSSPAIVYAVGDILRVPADLLYPIFSPEDIDINTVVSLTACLS